MTLDVRSLLAPGVESLGTYQPGKPLAELTREYGIGGAIKLASNENPLGASPRALDAARAALSDVARYPDSQGHALKQALARQLGVAVSQITLGNGSNDILELIARTFLSENDEALIAQHAFGMYELFVRAVGARPIVVPARAWGHDLRAMQRAVTARTRLVFIANPNNPTGTWTTGRELEELLQALPASVLVVVDEAYFEYVSELDYPDTIGMIASYPNLIVTRTFSKVHGLAGLRIGYGISQADVAGYLNRVRQPFNVNSVAAAAAAEALTDRDHVTRSVELNRVGMRQLCEGTERLGLGYIPSVANFLAIDLSVAAAPVYEALLRHGIIVRPIASYGMPSFLRVTVGLPQENERFLRTLRQVLSS